MFDILKFLRKLGLIEYVYFYINKIISKINEY